MKAISFSVYGEADKYLIGACRNLELARQFYPGWRCVFYVDHTIIDDHQLAHIVGNPDCDVIAMSPSHPAYDFKMAWRFLAIDSGSVERAIFRDADSRLNQRETEAVKVWEESGKAMHIMRDHPAHQFIPGGMWGLAKNCDVHLRPMTSLLGTWMKDHPERDYGADQKFLTWMLWPLWGMSTLIHDSSNERRNRWLGQPFPTKREWPRFVGEVWEIMPDGTEVPRDGDWQQISKEE